jgi:hypothetical protein
MINNFIKHGISGNDIDILVAWNPNDLTSTPENIEMWNKLVNKYNYVRFFFYQDTREDMSYIPSIYFNILKQHIKAHPELSTQPLFLHDSDILFTKPVDFSFALNDNIWYLSDTVGYIGTQYILTKGEDVYRGMCNQIGIDPLIPKLLNSNSGGAQHIVKNSTYGYWNKVEKDSIKLYKWFCEQEPLWKGEGYPIQKWTAGMWSLLWNLWLYDIETKVTEELDFSWATDTIDVYEKRPILHMAGVTDNLKTTKFYKGDYINIDPIVKLRDNPNHFDYIDKDSSTIKYIDNMKSYIQKYNI